MREANVRYEVSGKRPSNWHDPTQLKPCRTVVVAIADTLMRMALAELFQVHFSDVDFVEASTLSSALLRFQDAEDGCLILQRPAMSSADLEALKSWSAVRSRRLVILCSETTAASTRRWIEAGAIAILSNRLSADEFASAMRSIFAGQRNVKVESKRDDNAVDMEKLANAIVSLSPRSRNILDLLCDGRSTPEIAAALGIRRRTVKWHMTSLLSELNLSSRFRVVALVTRLRCSCSSANGPLNGVNAQ